MNDTQRYTGRDPDGYQWMFSIMELPTGFSLLIGDKHGFTTHDCDTWIEARDVLKGFVATGDIVLERL